MIMFKFMYNYEIEKNELCPLPRIRMIENQQFDFVTFNKDRIRKSGFNEPYVTEHGIWVNKPAGGMWACSYQENNEYISEWQKYLRCNRRIGHKRESTRAVLFNLKPDAKILRIDSIEDLKCVYKLCAVPGDMLREALSLPERRWITYGEDRINFWSLIDYGFDGIYLSKEGAEALTTLRFDPNKMYYIHAYDNYTSENMKYNLNAWEIESLLLFNIDCISEQKSIRTKKGE